MNWIIIAGVGAGALGGALLGSLRTCESGACPLTANPYRGAIFGALIGLVLTIGSASSGSASKPENNPAAGAAGVAEAPAPSASSAGQDKSEAEAGDSSVREITTPADYSEIIQAPGLNVIRFHALWCGPCRAFAPIFASAARHSGLRAKFYALDVDQLPDAARQAGISALPTTVIFRDGHEVQRIPGLISEQALLKELDGV